MKYKDFEYTKEDHFTTVKLHMDSITSDLLDYASKNHIKSPFLWEWRYETLDDLEIQSNINWLYKMCDWLKDT